MLKKAKTSNVRIDKYLSEELNLSRSLINKMINDKYILVNGTFVKSSFRVKENDEIEIKEGFTMTMDIAPENISLDIVYEDDDIIVINKPSGLVVHPGNGNSNGTLVNALMYHTKELSNQGGDNRLGIVHRIDKDTSGLMIVAKNNKVHNILAEGFKTKTIRREYIALLSGQFPHESATVDAPIGRDLVNRKKMSVKNENSKQAVTHLKVIKRYEDFTLVRLKLETGRTHQIRVHMKYIGYPVFNDPVYNIKKIDNFGQFLHSASLELSHPITGKRLCFEVPLPDIFQEFIRNLEGK